MARMGIDQYHQVVSVTCILDGGVFSCRVVAIARSSIRSTSVRYRLLISGEITPPCGTPFFPVFLDHAQ